MCMVSEVLRTKGGDIHGGGGILIGDSMETREVSISDDLRTYKRVHQVFGIA